MKDKPNINKRRRFVPDHVKNPGKYTKYDCKDVDKMTEKSNSAAALDFLNSIREKKDQEPRFNVEEQQKITFKRPSSFKKKKQDCGESTSNVDDDDNSKKTKIKSKPLKKTLNNKNLTLSHLMDDEVEES